MPSKALLSLKNPRDQVADESRELLQHDILLPVQLLEPHYRRVVLDREGHLALRRFEELQAGQQGWNRSCKARGTDHQRRGVFCWGKTEDLWGSAGTSIAPNVIEIRRFVPIAST